MTHVHYADMFITLMLGWVRGVTNWIWSMIRLGQSSSGRSFLAWFSDNWVRLVVVLMLACVAVDWLVWLVRWRPYWLWFGKKRRLVNDTGDSAPRPAPARRKAPPASEEPARHAPAPQFHSVALPRKKPEPAGDLFEIAGPSVPAAPQDLFAVAEESAPTPRPAQAKPAQKRSEKSDAIDWFE